MLARILDPDGAGLDHLGRDRLGVAALHLGHTRAHPVTRKAAPDEDDEAVQPRDAVPAEGERFDRELQLLVSLNGGGHAGTLAGSSWTAARLARMLHAVALKYRWSAPRPRI